MIPKIIHYCWFGRKPLPELALKCIESWKKYCPKYQIIEWNEDNFDINENIYIKQAYEVKKYAFVSDYVRLKVLYEYGGIYMDTDVELLKNLDKFLSESTFSGFETNTQALTAVLGSKKNQPILEDFLKYYKDRNFIFKNGMYDTTTNVKIVTDILLKKGIKLNGKFQIVDNFTLYPSDYFCPKNYFTGEISLTDNTYAIHHFYSSWKNNEEKILERKRQNNSKKYGIFLGRCYFYTLYVGNLYKKFGLSETIKIIKFKIKQKIKQ